MSSLSCPHIPEQLISYLNEIFPDSLSLALREGSSLERAIGVREVIDHLIGHHNAQKLEEREP